MARDGHCGFSILTHNWIGDEETTSVYMYRALTYADIVILFDPGSAVVHMGICFRVLRKFIGLKKFPH